MSTFFGGPDGTYYFVHWPYIDALVNERYSLTSRNNFKQRVAYRRELEAMRKADNAKMKEAGLVPERHYHNRKSAEAFRAKVESAIGVKLEVVEGGYL